MKLRVPFERAGSVFTHILYLAFGFVMSMNIAPFFALRYSNPLNISNFYIPQHFSPETNFTRVLLVVAGTIGLYYLMLYLDRRNKGLWFKAIVASFILGNFFLVYQLPAYGAQGGLDVFHSGEQLSPSLAYLQGKSLFTEIFFFHGVGDDVLMTLIGFKLFGTSIGSYILFGTIDLLIASAFFFAILGVLVRNRLAFMIIALLVYASSFVDILQIRDVGVWISLLLVYALLTRALSYRWRAAAMGSLGAIAIWECLFSVDRGLLLSGLCVMVVGVTLLLSQEKGTFKLDWRRAWKPGLREVAWLPVGAIVVTIGAYIWLGGQSFKEFLNMTFVMLPRIKGLISEYPLPSIDSASGFKVWLPTVALIVVVVMLVEVLRRDRWKPSGQLLFTVLLTIFSIAFLRSGVGRSDLGHIAYSATPLLLAGICVVQQAWKARISWWPSNQGAGFVAPLVLLAVVLTFANEISLVKLATIPQYRRDEVRAFIRMPRLPDNYWISPEVTQTKDYILANSAKDDGLFVFTSNPIFYYLTERPNPSRFYISWFADPQPYTDELMGDLKANPPKLIVYKDGLHDVMDQIPQEQRVPEVNKWVLENYHPAVTYGATEILERN